MRSMLLPSLIRSLKLPKGKIRLNGGLVNQISHLHLPIEVSYKDVMFL